MGLHSMGALFRRTAMIVRALLAVALAMLCTGCVGLMVDMPLTKDIRNPVPHNATKLFGGPNDLDRDRWACQAGPDPSVPQAKNRFLASWGPPKEKVVTAKGETWIYAEKGRWCGLWIFLIVPLPILLPVCETFDHVEFENEVAVRSTSRRMDGAGIGLGFLPPFPIPFLIRPARATENRPRVLVSPEKQPDLSCAATPTLPAASAELPQPTEDLVNCVAGGERRWTYRSNCD